MKILITGASGLIGSHLTAFLLMQGHSVGHLGRQRSRDQRVTSFTWNPAKDIIDHEATQWADAIVHLAGASVSEQRWTAERKKEIIDSRVCGAELLAKTLRREKHLPSVFVSASGIGWYGMVTSDNVFTENDPPAKDFFGEVCRAWENAADLVEEVGVRTVKLRIGMVLAKEGGALPVIARPVKFFVGSPLGSGKQWTPWIHIDDLCALFLKAIEDTSMQGAYNVAAPQHATNKTLVKTIGSVLHRPVFLPPVPKFALKMALGEMAGIVTEGSRVSVEKLQKTGFTFQHPVLKEAIEHLLGNRS